MQQSQNENWCGVSEEILGILRCLHCQRRLVCEAEALVCLNCASRYPVVDGIPRFVEQQFYAGSFGFQWLKHDKTQLDNESSRKSEKDFILRTRFRPEELAGKLVLDVGCGMGRYAEVATKWGATVVGVDLSRAVEAARRNLADRDAVILQADAFRLPFAAESFDYIYSLGVLHHTPDCEAAVKALGKYLKPGGILAVWLYSGYNKWYRFSDFWRRYTHKMKPETLHSVLKVAVPVVYHLERGLQRVPLVGRPAAGAIHHVFPVNRQKDPEARMLDTFDWYSPKYQSKHTYEQVTRWYEAMGMEDMRVGECSIAMRGRKPLRSDSLGG